jgi:hypothetical protein
VKEEDGRGGDEAGFAVEDVLAGVEGVVFGCGGEEGHVGAECTLLIWIEVCC